VLFLRNFTALNYTALTAEFSKISS